MGLASVLRSYGQDKISEYAVVRLLINDIYIIHLSFFLRSAHVPHISQFLVYILLKV